MKIEQLQEKELWSWSPTCPEGRLSSRERIRVKRWIKLASNENLLGPSLKWSSNRNELRNIHFYPEAPCSSLRTALARRFSLGEGNVVISNGAITSSSW